MRSEAAIAACSTLNFSDRSEIGRQKRSEYWMKATSTPRVSPPARTPPSPVDQDERGGDGGQQLDRRVEDRVVEDRLHVGVVVPAVDGGEGLAVPRLAAEQLHHRHAREVLLEEGVDARHPPARLAEGPPRALAEPVGEGEEERDHGEGDEGEAPVEGHHHRHDPEQGEEVAEDGDDARGEQLVHRVHVGGDARHEPAHRVAVEVAHVQPLQVREDLAPHVLHDPLPGHLHDVVLPEAHDEGGGEGQEVEPGHPGEARRVARRDVAVDRDLGEVRPHEVDPGLGDDQDEGGRDRSEVRAQVPEEPPQQLEVVALGGDRVVVGRPGTAHATSSPFSISCSSSWRRWRSA